ncbi:outer membrane protein assembly factor BamB family protein [Streptomyces sp. SS]|uniref:outer membrane protein assembly factor BamB family protein n=1 Tax=Streptomyces sp. SS TaxID=260742 RepID=UPI000FFBE30B|nr:PQQ-binding-like beta-propeller repeat protein [Streptomyces sp. SS]
MAVRTDGAGRVRARRSPGWAAGLGQWLAGVLVLAVVVGGIAAFVVPGYIPTNGMSTVWHAPGESEAPEGGAATWLVGDSVVRSRFDGVTAFDVRSGKERWEYLVPARAETCGASADTAVGVALIAYRQARPTKDENCAAVAAVDLTDGRELWRAAGVSGELRNKVVTSGGGLGVLVVGGRLRGVDLKSGAPRWTTPLGKGCSLHGLGVAPKQVVAALMCGTEATLASFDPASGTTRWTVPVDARRGVDADGLLSVLSADPPTVRVDGPNGTGLSSVLAFGPDGRDQGRVDGAGDFGEISTTAIAATKGVVPAFSGVVAFDLANGAQLWRKGGGASALDVSDGRVTIVRPSYKHGDLMYVVDAATGDEEDERDFQDSVSSAGDVLTFQDLVVVVHGGTERPFTVYDRW